MRVPVIVEAVHEGRIAGVPPSATTSGYHKILGVQTAPTPQRYKEVQLLENVFIGTTKEDTRRFSFVMGRRSSDNKWEIVNAAALTDDGAWREVPVNESAGVPAKEPTNGAVERKDASRERPVTESNSSVATASP